MKAAHVSEFFRFSELTIVIPLPHRIEKTLSRCCAINKIRDNLCNNCYTLCNGPIIGSHLEPGRLVRGGLCEDADCPVIIC
jgi:hypothetical protein